MPFVLDGVISIFRVGFGAFWGILNALKYGVFPPKKGGTMDSEWAPSRIRLRLISIATLFSYLMFYVVYFRCVLKRFHVIIHVSIPHRIFFSSLLRRLASFSPPPEGGGGIYRRSINLRTLEYLLLVLTVLINASCYLLYARIII